MVFEKIYLQLQKHLMDTVELILQYQHYQQYNRYYFPIDSMDLLLLDLYNQLLLLDLLFL